MATRYAVKLGDSKDDAVAGSFPTEELALAAAKAFNEALSPDERVTSYLTIEPIEDSET